MQGYGDNFTPVVPCDDDLIHTEEHPFCHDPTCPCKEDPDNIALLQQHITDGLATPEEATRIVQGKQI